MSKPESLAEQATEIVRVISQEGQRALRPRQRRIKRIIKGIVMLLAAPFVVVPAVIAGGLIFGSHGFEGLILAPPALIAAWAAIVYWMFRRTKIPLRISDDDVATLPARTQAWLEDERGRLPGDAQRYIDSIGRQLEALVVQVQGLNAQAPLFGEVKRLVGEELPELVRGYRKVPRALTRQPLYDGPSPERRLVEGLETIDKQLSHLTELLAADHLHALATHERYLDLKYKHKPGLE